ncbi:MAG: Ribonuclease H-like protein [Thermoproteota archaeon]|nr:Ribonuclease H-like protein [Thermoproteota archaeon]
MEDNSSILGRLSDLSVQRKRLLKRASESLGRRIGNGREYSVISEQDEPHHMHGGRIQETWVYQEEYSNAMKLKSKLVQQFKGKALEDVIPGKIISNNQGACYCIEAECDTHIKNTSLRKSREVILSDLKLLSGVGPARERKLKQQGYQSIRDLTKHPIWRESAQEFLSRVDLKDVSSLQSWFNSRLPKSHPLAHYLAGFCRSEDFAIIDIETMGLFGRPIILLGIAKSRASGLGISQFLLRDISDEAGALWELVSHLDGNSAFITYNGRAFDIPYIQERLAYYGIRSSLNNPHFDALHFARRAWRSRLDNCRLETVEKYFGVQREIDIPSTLIPEFYESYLKSRNVGPLVAIVEHNRQDLITLANIFSKLYDEWNI